MTKLFRTVLAAATVLLTGSCSKEVVVYETAADVAFDISSSEVDRNETIHFTDASRAPSGSDMIAWDWDFGDGEGSSQQNPSYAYSTVGKYTVKLTVWTNNGRSAFATREITVNTPSSELAHADFSYSPDSPLQGDAVAFTDASVPSQGATLTTWEWDFGDGNTSSSQNPSHTFASSGSFTIKLTVTDGAGKSDETTKDLLVANPDDLVVLLWQKPLMGAIQNMVSPALSADGSAVYMWADQTASSPAHTYDVTLKAFDTSNGDLLWGYNVNDALAALNTDGGVRQVFCSPSVGPNGDIYVAARDLKNAGAARKSFLFAIKSDGVKRWHYAFGLDANFNYVTPAIDASGNIYIGHLTTSPFQIAILRNTDGAAAYAPISLSLGVRSGLSVDRNGNVYFCSTGTNGLFAYAQAGTQQFQFNTNFLTTGGDITIASDGTIYSVADGSSGGMVTAITSGGAQKWQYTLPGKLEFGGVALGSDGTVYASGGNVNGAVSAGIVALNPADGTLIWAYPTSENVNNCVPLVDDRGYIHFVTDAGTYHIVKPNGEKFASKSLGARCYASPVMDAAGKLYVGVETVVGTSVMQCLSSGATGYAASDWPMKGGNPQRTHLQK